MNTYFHHINRLKDRYRLRRVGELGLLSLGAALLTYALLIAFRGGSVSSITAASLVGIGVFAFRYMQLKLHRLQESDIAAYLNRHFDELEDSTDLLIADPESLEPLQRVQRRRLITAFEAATGKIQWPEQWRLSLLTLGLGLLACFLIGWNGGGKALHLTGTGSGPDSTSTKGSILPAALDTYEIVVDPPAYTGLKDIKTSDFNLKIPEGSQVQWSLNFSGAPERVMLVFSNGDSTVLESKENSYTLSKMIRQSGYYSISWQDRGKLKSSDFYKLEIVEDQAPQVNITNQEQFVEFPWREEIEVTVKATLSDDYGLTEAYVIATVSKGSGESVKFREERLPFSRPKKFAGRQSTATLEINTKALGMEPGDELYYYLEAWDNHRPQRQSNRTETYFIQLQDTSSQMISFEGGLGVDLMPEYFRSQRQIIIDSEKLLAEKAKVKKKEFDDRSNNLAHDQKVLRLRYGQFMGEEFESGMTRESQPEEETAPENEEEILEKYGHAHDTDNEHNLVEEHDHEHDHGHDHDHDEAHNPEEDEESPLEAFIHAHDNTEEATFFIQSVKAKLRAALNLMWDAELHLRMSDPAQSLPYQYKILKLLKEISQDSRIYVHRTGFDAPPLKEEKRLTGDLEEITNSRASYLKSDEVPYPAVQEALPLVEEWLRRPPPDLEGAEKERLLAAGNELAGAAIEQPDVYLPYLSALRTMLDGDLTESKLQQVREAFWRLLPNSPRSLGEEENSAHPLQDAFIQQLKAQSFR